MRIKLATLLALFLLFCFTGDAHTLNDVESKSSSNKIKVPKLGVYGTCTVNGYTVEKVNSKGAAEIAGIEEGDILLKIDNIKIISRKGMRDLLNKSIKSEREVEISVLRGSSLMTIRLKPRIVEEFPTLLKLRDLVDETKVAVAVIAGDVSSSLPVSANVNIDDWKQSIRRNNIAEVEETLLSQFSHNENFKLVDRSIINKIIEEFKFNESGFVSEEMRVKLGKMYGVTHIIQTDFSRFPYGRQGHEDVITRKLINLQTGTIEASDFSRTVKE